MCNVVLIHNLFILSDMPYLIHHWQNLKMKISHPRFLLPGRMKDMDMEFPACLQKQISPECGDVQSSIVEKSNSLLFSFPEVSKEHSMKELYLQLSMSVLIFSNFLLPCSSFVLFCRMLQFRGE